MIIHCLFHPLYIMFKWFYQYLCKGNESFSHFILIQQCGFSLILNGAWSEDGLNRRPKLVTIVNYWWWCCMLVYLMHIYCLIIQLIWCLKWYLTVVPFHRPMSSVCVLHSCFLVREVMWFMRLQPLSDQVDVYILAQGLWKTYYFLKKLELWHRWHFMKN